MNMYQQELLDHYYNPRNRRVLASPDFCSSEHNPSCGDRVSVQGRLHDNFVTELCFQGVGCVISQAAASLVTEKYQNSSVDLILAINQDAMFDLLGMSLGPTRVKCALLVVRALKQGILRI